MKLFVGNLPWSIDDDGLRALFGNHGVVHKCNVVLDRDSGRSRGFAFVEMDDSDGEAAIQRLDGADVDGRKIHVSEARERERPPRREYNNDRGGYGRY